MDGVVVVVMLCEVVGVRLVMCRQSINRMWKLNAVTELTISFKFGLNHLKIQGPIGFHGFQSKNWSLFGTLLPH